MRRISDQFEGSAVACGESTDNATRRAKSGVLAVFRREQRVFNLLSRSELAQVSKKIVWPQKGELL
jgi:hypothetical protein